MIVYRCAKCDLEFEVLPYADLLVKICEKRAVDDKEHPAPVYGIRRNDNIVCPVFGCHGELQHVRE